MKGGKLTRRHLGISTLFLLVGLTACSRSEQDKPQDVSPRVRDQMLCANEIKSKHLNSETVRFLEFEEVVKPFTDARYGGSVDEWIQSGGKHGSSYRFRITSSPKPGLNVTEVRFCDVVPRPAKNARNERARRECFCTAGTKN